MPNQSYLDFEDELENLRGDTEPYDSISDRMAIPDFASQSVAEASPEMGTDVGSKVRSAIQNKMMTGQQGMAPPPSSSMPSNDPLVQAFQKDQESLQGYADAKRRSDLVGNLGQSFSQFAQGSRAPTGNPGLYQNIAGQNADLFKSQVNNLGKREQIANAISARQSREGIAKDNRLARQEMTKVLKNDREDSKRESQINKWTTALKEDLDANKARGGNLGNNQKRVDNAERVQALLDQVNNNPDPRQMEELAISAQALLSSSGSPAAEQVKALIPKTAQGDINKFKEWLTNNPTGTGQQEFVKRMAETVSREKDIALAQVQKAQRQRLSAYGKFKEADPDTYNQIIGSYGLSENAPKGMSAMEEGKAMAGGPKSGDMEEGYRFKGGDPSDPNSWEKVN